jgi:hypothetical protein
VRDVETRQSNVLCGTQLGALSLVGKQPGLEAYQLSPSRVEAINGGAILLFSHVVVCSFGTVFGFCDILVSRASNYEEYRLLRRGTVRCSIGFLMFREKFCLHLQGRRDNLYVNEYLRESVICSHFHLQELHCPDSRDDTRTGSFICCMVYLIFCLFLYTSKIFQQRCFLPFFLGGGTSLFYIYHSVMLNKLHRAPD